MSARFVMPECPRFADLPLSMPQIVNQLRAAAKQEDIIIADLLPNLNIRPVYCTENDAAVQNKLHIGSAGRFGTGCGNMLKGTQKSCNQRNGFEASKLQATETVRNHDVLEIYH